MAINYIEKRGNEKRKVLDWIPFPVDWPREIIREDDSQLVPGGLATLPSSQKDRLPVLDVSSST